LLTANESMGARMSLKMHLCILIPISYHPIWAMSMGKGSIKTLKWWKTDNRGR